MTGLLEMALLSFALLAFLAWAVAAFLAPERFSPQMSPRQRAWRARFWMYLPLWAPLVVLFSALLPGLAGGLLGHQDHCTAHGSHHHHLCVFHPPHLSHDLFAWSLIVGILAPALAVMLRALLVQWRAQRLAQALVRLARASVYGDDVRLLDREEPIALTVGTVRPVILLSTGLIASVAPSVLRVVIAHERAHVRHHDAIWGFCDALAAAILPAEVQRALLQQIALAREQACDVAASAEAGDDGDLRVAAALTEVARLAFARPSFGLSVVESSLEARVAYLLSRPPAARGWLMLPSLAVLGLCALGAGPIHTLIERVATRLLH